jgi:hypothetical protein
VTVYYHLKVKLQMWNAKLIANLSSWQDGKKMADQQFSQTETTWIETILVLTSAPLEIEIRFI